MTDINALAYVGCYRQVPRGQKISLIVVHTNEGPEGPNAAEGLAHYIAQPHPPDYPGYHVVVDENSAVRCAQDQQRVNGAGGVNDRALHICLIGYAAQSRDQWLDAASKAEIVTARDIVLQWCQRWGVPFVHLTPEQVRDGAAGVCGHGDVSKYFSASEGHTDPGAGFPWDIFFAGPPAPTERKRSNMAQFLVRDNDDPQHPVTYITDWDRTIRKIQDGGELGAIQASFQDAGMPIQVRDVPRKYLLRIQNPLPT